MILLDTQRMLIISFLAPTCTVSLWLCICNSDSVTLCLWFILCDSTYFCNSDSVSLTLLLWLCLFDSTSVHSVSVTLPLRLCHFNFASLTLSLWLCLCDSVSVTLPLYLCLCDVVYVTLSLWPRVTESEWHAEIESPKLSHRYRVTEVRRFTESYCKRCIQAERQSKVPFINIYSLCSIIYSMINWSVVSRLWNICKQTKN